MAQWCNPLTLQPEQSGEMGSIPETNLLEHHDKQGVTESIRSALFL